MRCVSKFASFCRITLGLRVPFPCVLCKSASTAEYSLGSRILDLPGHSESRVMRCRDCSMLFLAPYLSDEQLRALYSESYFSQVEGPSLALAPLANTAYRDVVEIRSRKFEATLDALRPMIGHDALLLDVGAGTGDFVYAARRRGLRADGLEFSEFAVQEAKNKFGLNLSIGRLGEFKAPHRYDAIHLNHVLEHIPDPHAAVRWIDELLSAEGVVYVEVPFQFNVIERAKYLFFNARTPFNLHSLHHPLFFTPETLLRLFADHGYQCLKLNLFDTAHYPMNGKLSRPKGIVWRALAALGQGLFVEAFFRKEKGL